MHPRYYKLLIVVAIALVTFMLMLLDRTHIPHGDSAAPLPLARTIAPDVTFTRLDGGTIALHSLKGHPVLLHFWASWCAPCRAEFGDLLARIQADNHGTILLAVSADTSPDDARKFLLPYRKKFKSLFEQGRVIIAIDPQGRVIADQFQTYQYPETIIIDENLVMQRKIIGVMGRDSSN